MLTAGLGCRLIGAARFHDQCSSRSRSDLALRRGLHHAGGIPASHCLNVGVGFQRVAWTLPDRETPQSRYSYRHSRSTYTKPNSTSKPPSNHADQYANYYGKDGDPVHMRPNVQANRRAVPTLAKVKSRAGPSG